MAGTTRNSLKGKCLESVGTNSTTTNTPSSTSAQSNTNDVIHVRRSPRNKENQQVESLVTPSPASGKGNVDENPIGEGAISNVVVAGKNAVPSPAFRQLFSSKRKDSEGCKKKKGESNTEVVWDVVSSSTPLRLFSTNKPTTRLQKANKKLKEMRRTRIITSMNLDSLAFVSSPVKSTSPLSIPDSFSLTKPDNKQLIPPSKNPEGMIVSKGAIKGRKHHPTNSKSLLPGVERYAHPRLKGSAICVTSKQFEGTSVDVSTGRKDALEQKVPNELVRILAPLGGPFPKLLQMPPSEPGRSSNIPKGNIDAKDFPFPQQCQLGRKGVEIATGVTDIPSVPSLRSRSRLSCITRSFSCFQEESPNVSESEKERRNPISRGNGSIDTASHDLECHEDRTLLKRKRRLPPKKITTDTASGPSGSTLVSGFKRKRGRPRKEGTKPNDSENLFPGDVTASKGNKGRPPRKKKPETSQEKKHSVAVVETTKKRGRPPKKLSSLNQVETHVPDAVTTTWRKTIRTAKMRTTGSDPMGDIGMIPAPAMASSTMAICPVNKPVENLEAETDADEGEKRPAKRFRYNCEIANSGGEVEDFLQDAAAKERNLSLTLRTRKDRSHLLSRHAKLHQTFDFEQYFVHSTKGRREVETVAEHEESMQRSNTHSPIRVVTCQALKKSRTDIQLTTQYPPTMLAGNSLVRRHKYDLPAQEKNTSTKPFRFDSSRKKLIIDTTIVPESVLDAITHQVQACLTHRRSPVRSSNQERGLHDDSSGSHFPSNVDYIEGKEVGAKMNALQLGSLGLHDHNCDSRSVTSELTNDFSKIVSYRSRDDALELRVGTRRRIQVHRPELCERFSEGAKVDNASENDEDDNKLRPNQWNDRASELKSVPPASGCNRCSNEETRSCASSRRRHVFWNCSDSLAGSYSGLEKGRDVHPFKHPHILREVWTKTSSPTRHSLASMRLKVQNYSNEEICSKPQGLEEGKEKKCLAGASVRKITNAAMPLQCGKCSGCLRIWDCQTCDNCLDKLRRYGAMPPPMGKDECCLKRQCQRARRIGHSDVLWGGLATLVGSRHTDDDEPAQAQKPAVVARKEDNASESPRRSDHDEEYLLQDGLNISNAPWEGGDDWSVDYSYLSEPLYRHQLGGRKTFSVYRKSGVSSLCSKRFLPFPFSRKLPLNQDGGGTRSSLSTTSSTKKDPPIGRQGGTRPPIPQVDTSFDRNRRPKRKTDSLHNLQLYPAKKSAATMLPMESLRENAQSLQALMQYDESDQDWV